MNTALASVLAAGTSPSQTLIYALGNATANVVSLTSALNATVAPAVTNVATAINTGITGITGLFSTGLNLFGGLLG